MKVLRKTLLIALGLTCLSFQAHSYETSGYAKVISSKAVWSFTTVTRPETKDECVETHVSHKNPENLVGDIIIGGLIGAAIGNAVSDAHGMGTIGTSLGALLAADSHSRSSPDYKCSSKTVYRQHREKTLSHYDVKVRLDDRFITFRSDRPFERHSFVKVRTTEHFTLMN